jgi:hypothetical protein
MVAWEEMTNKQQLECIIWDAYKDAYGVRPRHMNLEAMTEEELNKELEFLGKVIDENEKQRRADEAVAIDEFETHVAETIRMGAGDRETALRWIMEASEAQGDWEYFCFLEGLPYGYFNKETV